MQRLGPNAEPVGVSPHFIERDQAVVNVKRRVLDPLRHHRSSHLLELTGEAQLLGPVVVARGSGESPSSMSRMKRKTRLLTSGLRILARRTAASTSRRSVGLAPAASMYER